MANKAQIAKVTDEILDAFKAGKLARPLAQTFLTFGLHCERWSVNNQMVVHLLGHDDAATYNQWRAMGRQVRKGCKAFYLMKPHMVYATITDEDTGESERVPVYVRGFGFFPVFPFSATDEIDGVESTYDTEQQERQEFIDSLPLLEVAESWGLKVQTYKGKAGGAHGWAQPGRAIGLGVANVSTWLHELIHQAEDRLGKLTVNGQETYQEIVAEFGASVLATMLGYDEIESDWAGAFEYIRGYVHAKNKKAPNNDDILVEVMRVTNRVTAAIALILETSEALQAA